MKATELITALRGALQPIKAQSQELIPIANLENYLEEMEKIANANETASIEGEKQDLAASRFAHDFEVWKVRAPLQSASDLEMLKAVLEAGQTALKSATLINGGAAVALLAFLGNMLSRDAAKDIAYLIPEINGAMLSFVIGVGCAGLASGLRYLSQDFYTGNKDGWGAALKIPAIILGFASFGCFFWGGYAVYLTLAAI